MSASRCSICLHPQRAMVEAALSAGKPARQVAQSFGVSKDSIYRHVRGSHVVPSGKRPPVVVAPKAGAPAGAAPLSAYEQMRAITEGLAAIDVSKLSPRDQLWHLDAYSKAVEKLGRMEPPSARVEPELAVKLREKQEHVEVIARVLRKFPEARAAVAAAYRARRSGSGEAPEDEEVA